MLGVGNQENKRKMRQPGSILQRFFVDEKRDGEESQASNGERERRSTSLARARMRATDGTQKKK
jgi:hypothetical protein